MQLGKIACIADSNQKSKEICAYIADKYKFDIIKKINNNIDVDLLIVFGGDGFMLHCMHNLLPKNVLIYGINTGTLGFLLNPLDEEVDLKQKLNNLSIVPIHPLKGSVNIASGQIKTIYAINEISLLRQTHQTADITLQINNVEYLDKLICDGILVSTPAGSSAYNYSAGGPIIPLETNLLALTPLNAFRPRRWRGALLPSDLEITIIVNDYNKRPVSAVADFKEVRDIRSINIIEDRNISIRLAFDNENNLKQRLFREQFLSG